MWETNYTKYRVRYDIPKPNGCICICWRSGATEPLIYCNDSNHYCHTEGTDEQKNQLSKEQARKNAQMQS